MGKEKKDWEEYKVRFQPFEAQAVREKAHRARLPFSVYIRECAVGDVPRKAPPLVAELSFEAQELLKICYGCASNLTQIDAHAQAAGEPLSRLSSTGLLFKLGSRTRQIGLQAKSDRLDQQAASELLARLEAPARALNDQLARPLNEGGQPGPGLAVWKEVLDALQDALLEGAE